MNLIKEEPRLAGEVFDEEQKLIGRYVYLKEGDQEQLDSFFKSWLKTYESNQDFFLTLDLECLARDTLVTTNTGDIIELQNIKEHSKILGSETRDSKASVIDYVDTYNLVNKGKKSCRKISTRHGLPITASNKHAFLTQQGWKFCEDLTTEDYLICNRKKIDFPENLSYSDKEIALVGWFIAEGCRSGTSIKSVTISVAEKEYIEWVKDHANPYPTTGWKDKGNNCMYLAQQKTGRNSDGSYRRNEAVTLISSLGLLGKYSYEKEIPSKILQSSNRQVALLLRCMFSGDGTVKKDRLGLCYNTTSKRLSEQVVLLLSRFGISSSISEVVDKREERYKKNYFVQVLGESAGVFYKEIGFIGRKQIELRACVEKYTRRIETSRMPRQCTPLIKDILINESLTYHILTKAGIKVTRQWYEEGSFSLSQVKELLDYQEMPRLRELYNLYASPDVFLTPIFSIEDVGEQEVLDISVSTKEFIANNLIVHNTTGLKPHEGQILLVSISWDGRNSIIFCPEYFDLTLFKEVISTIPLNNQNIKFDLKWLGYHYGTESSIYLDTMVGTQLGWAGVFPTIPQGTFGLGNIAKHLLSGYVLEKETRKEFIGMKLSDGFSRRQIEYAVKDSLITHKLVWPIFKRLQNQGLWDIWETIEKPLIEILVRTELKGVKINTFELKKLLTVKEKELSDVYARIMACLAIIPVADLPKFPNGVFNPGSSQQVVNILTTAGIKVMNTEKSTLQITQADNKNDLLGAIIEWRKLKTIISKFLTKWLSEHIDPSTESIYTTFNTCGTETGRLAAKEPNMQQIPGDLRPMVIARPGCKIVSMDYSQFEFRAAAAITGEKYLIDAFIDRAKMLPQIKALGIANGYNDPDSFVKAVTKNQVALSTEQSKLVHEFALTDIHRRNAALILNKDVSDVTSTERGIGKCVSLNTYVHTNKGIYTLREMLPKKLTPDTYYNLKGIEVLTDVGYKSAPTIYYNGKSSGLQIVTRSGRKIKCTPTHKFRTINKEGNYIWITAKELSIGSDVFVKLGAPYKGTIKKFPLEILTKEAYCAFARLIGLTIRIGEICEGTGTIMYPGAYDEEVRELLTKIGYTKTKINGPTKQSNFIFVYREDIINWIEDLSSIPGIFLHDCDEEVIGSLLRGLSSKCNLGSMFAYENSRLLKQIQNLCLRLGIMTYISPKIHNFCGKSALLFYGYNMKLLNYYLYGGTKPVLNELNKIKLSCSSKMYEKLIDAGFFGLEEALKLSEDQRALIKSTFSETELATSEFMVKNNLMREVITSISPINECDMGDLTVPDNSTVVYEGFVTHNTLGYSVLYGAGANRVQESLAKEGFYHTLPECKTFLDQFFNYLPKVEEFIKQTHAKVLKPGYISTVMGRKRFFELPPKYFTRKYALELESCNREAVNYCFQGANADATKKAMVLIDEAFRKYDESVRPTILLTVHDEIVSEIHESNLEEVIELGQKIMIECGLESINYGSEIECSVTIGSCWLKG